jgi:hypothetical protein
MADNPTPMKSEYDSLPAIALRVKKYHSDRLAASKNVLDYAIKAGADLIRAKKDLKHGDWLPWLRDQCALSERTAQDYMKLAESKSKLDAKNALGADLGLKEALRLIEDKPQKETPGELGKYEKARQALIKKLGKLSPADAEEAAQRTIQDLQNIVAELAKPAVAKAA